MATTLFLPWTGAAEVATSLPATAIARFFGESFERRTNQRLRAVAGDARIASLVSLDRGRPRLLLDATPERTPWLTPAKFNETGGVVVWRASDTAGTPPRRNRETISRPGAGSAARLRVAGDRPPAAAADRLGHRAAEGAVGQVAAWCGAYSEPEKEFRPHPEERALARVSKDGCNGTRGHPSRRWLISIAKTKISSEECTFQAERSEATVSEKFLGYFLPKDGGHVHGARFEKPLSEEQFSEFENVIRITSILRPFIIDFLGMEENYRILSRMPKEMKGRFEAQSNPMTEGAIGGTWRVWQAQNAVTNFLSSASALRDRSKTRLRQRYGKDSEQLAALQAAIKTAVDGSIEYRFFYHLRNYAQHHDIPLSLVPIKSTVSEQSKIEANISIVIAPSKLASGSREHKQFFNLELSKLSEDIDSKRICASRISGFMLGC